MWSPRRIQLNPIDMKHGFIITNLLWYISLALWLPAQATEQFYKLGEYQPVPRTVGDRPNIVLITLDHAHGSDRPL